ncbi:MAG: helix-turn-helix transcriptional regulator [Burkholderiales bacterium]|nr:helix-turn-helix transcriptional regulator [Burkholderiales bacterium]
MAENSRPADPEDESAQVRFVAKGLRSLRGRLGLSAESFGRLIGVSGQSIYNWERQVTTPRAEQRKMLAQVRGIGKRQALARLQSMAAAASATKPAARVQRQSARRPAG